MPRTARFIYPGVPHHVTQRGNRRGQVFYSDIDYRTYLAWLREYADVQGVAVLAYCLMNNHVHLVVEPAHGDSLQRMLRQLHVRYAQNLNRRHGWRGHVFQGRYFSSVLDEPYFWSAIRYVELNPVRAGMVTLAESYPWSSAAAHCGLRDDAVLGASAHWKSQFNAVGDWSAWLSAGVEPEKLVVLRALTSRGLPCGSPEFIESLEATSGRSLQPRPRGRPQARSSPLETEEL